MERHSRFPAIAICLCYIVLLLPAAAAAPVSVHAIVPPYEAVAISGLSYLPEPYDPTVGKAAVSFYLSKPASVSATVFNMSGIPVNLLGPYFLTEKMNSIDWDGRDLDGTQVPPSWYPFYLTATDGVSTDEKMVLMAVNYGKPLSMKSQGVEPKRFDPKKSTAKIKVWLSRDAFVDVTIKSPSGSTVKSETELFWLQGTNSYIWDGTDDTGQIVSPGTYTCLFSVTDSGGNTASVSENIVVLKDSSKSINSTLYNLTQWFLRLF